MSLSAQYQDRTYVNIKVDVTSTHNSDSLSLCLSVYMYVFPFIWSVTKIVANVLYCPVVQFWDFSKGHIINATSQLITCISLLYGGSHFSHWTIMTFHNFLTFVMSHYYLSIFIYNLNTALDDSKMFCQCL